MRTRVLLGAGVTLLALGLRLWGLGMPAVTYGDESWYSFDATTYLGGGVALTELGTPPPEHIREEVTWMHPPLGKWTIAMGVGPMGNSPLGRRLPAAVAGTATVLLVFLLGLRLWRSAWWAASAAVFLAVDGLHVVQSRMSMLDVFVTAWITAGALLLVIDRLHREDAGPSTGLRRWAGSKWRLWAGVCLGAAFATKWSAMPFLLAALACGLAGALDPPGTPMPDRLRRSLIALVAIPLGTYLLSYGQFFLQYGPDLPGFLRLQWAMVRFHMTHVIDAPARSAPWTWPLLLKPIRYWPVRGVMTMDGARVLGLGNPAVWWGFLLALPVLIRRAVRRDLDALVVLGGWGLGYLPWFLVGRTQFLWYMLPAVPFMCLGLVVAIRALPARRALGIGVVSAALVTGFLFLPVWTDHAAPWVRLLFWLPGWRT